MSLLAVAADFYALGAPFVAALEIMIYAGAIMVLFVFVVMMLNLAEHSWKVERDWLKPKNWLGPGFLALILLGELFICVSASRTRRPRRSQLLPSRLARHCSEVTG